MPTLTPTLLRRKFRGRIVALLNDLRHALIKAGFDVDKPFDTTDDEYEWTLIGGPAGRNPDDTDEAKDFDVRVTIAESAERDDDDPFGVNFSLRAATNGGESILSVTPYNYTPQVWVSRKSPEAVEERWREFCSGCDPTGVADTIKDFYKAG